MMCVNPIMENLLPSDNFGRQFALCESCFWSATVLRMKDQVAIACPMCAESGVSMISLAINESYRLSLSPKSGA
jgi:hypothetical protein